MPPISGGAFRDALRHFPSGVTLVTIHAGGITHGLTVSAFSSVSPEPPLVAVMIDHKHFAQSLLRQPGASFAVSFLAHDQRELSDHFAWSAEESRFARGRWSVATTGAPVLEDAIAWLDCRIRSEHEAGGHSLWIGEVVASAVPRPEEQPLVYWNRGYRSVSGA
jgi:flavin reductase (DIM6/NTAB) family NADH-FMN oxidoreductase RutF